MDRRTQVNKLVSLAGEKGSCLDDEVHDAASQDATLANNAGLRGQVEFLLDRWPYKDVEAAVLRTGSED